MKPCCKRTKTLLLKKLRKILKGQAYLVYDSIGRGKRKYHWIYTKDYILDIIAQLDNNM